MYIVGSVVLADSLVIFLAVCLYCIPISHLWDPIVPGKWVNRTLFTTLGSSKLLVTDLIMYIMPMPVIWKLQMNLRRELELLAIFLLGCL